jgi:hypothetical protein
MRLLQGLCLGLWIVAGSSLPAVATSVHLSQESSDATDPALLTATLGFAVSGGDTLVLTVENLTGAPNAYQIDRIYFNGTPDVTALSLLGVTSSVDGPVSSWTLSTSVKAGAFGRFDFALMDANGSPGSVGPGEILTFELQISGSGPFSANDFVSELSSIPPGSRPAIAAAKFVQGPGSDSAVGASLVHSPEPTTALLVAIGAGALAVRRRPL